VHTAMNLRVASYLVNFFSNCGKLFLEKDCDPLSELLSLVGEEMSFFL
jgi:hypothetical protein